MAFRIVSFILIAFLVSNVNALEIRNVRPDRLTFDPGQGEIMAITYELSDPAAVELLIYDARNYLVDRRTDQELVAGERTITWGGKDFSDTIVPSEAYHYVLKATASSGESQTYDLTDLTGGQRLNVTDVEWDSSSGGIRYRLSETARVAIRIGLKDNGPLLRTLVEWVPRMSGSNEEDWDGWDQSNVLELGDHPNLSIFVDAYALSDNTIMVGAPPRQSRFIQTNAGQEESRQRQPTEKKAMYNHSDQPIESRGGVDVSLSLESSYAREDGVTAVSGTVPIQFNISSGDLRRAMDRRFETVFFVDGIFAHENEVGYVPATWHWDTTDVNPGIHYVTVNFRGYEGNFGVATLKVFVESPDK
ncbi:MAG: hypothetical protein WD397_16935 [Wenzhouxiangellaceae bacterium]